MHALSLALAAPLLLILLPFAASFAPGVQDPPRAATSSRGSLARCRPPGSSHARPGEAFC
ncbi:uncharacterized protein K444DRAFT_616213 [Hyaloscypha bicolor E]|uniref:Uncharacterized protein n=1 Tax=Hyaloscypha bicolor E TaxID=1095630 RepID=A0A2J6T033_9HELO|nr:uncharacterized protein K444DRAFT_616213 [Hyaloscypha bicolor E]PMD56385.1 hypothetical protein K444DRAFT_616213 [Hyaloscypha bicolor E]